MKYELTIITNEYYQIRRGLRWADILNTIQDICGLPSSFHFHCIDFLIRFEWPNGIAAVFCTQGSRRHETVITTDTRNPHAAVLEQIESRLDDLRARREQNKQLLADVAQGLADHGACLCTLVDGDDDDDDDEDPDYIEHGCCEVCGGEWGDGWTTCTCEESQKMKRDIRRDCLNARCPICRADLLGLVEGAAWQESTCPDSISVECPSCNRELTFHLEWEMTLTSAVCRQTLCRQDYDADSAWCMDCHNYDECTRLYEIAFRHV